MPGTQEKEVTKTCGKHYPRKVKGNTTKMFVCQKPPGHDEGENASPHGRVNAARVTEVPLTALASHEVVPETEYIPLVSHKRSDAQKKVDSHVQAAHRAWVEAGKPALAKDSPRMRYLVPAEHVEGIRVMIRRAGTHLNLRTQIAAPVQHESGNVSVQYRVTDRPPAKPKAEVKASVPHGADKTPKPAIAAVK